MGLLRMRMDALHYALLAVLVLLVFYAASTYGLFKEGERNGPPEAGGKCGGNPWSANWLQAHPGCSWP